MNREQTIYFNQPVDYRVQEGGLIDKNTEILNLFIDDMSDSLRMALVGNKLVWSMEIWLDFEKSKIEKIKQINIISCRGDLTLFKKYCQTMFPNVEVNLHDFRLGSEMTAFDMTLRHYKDISMPHKIHDHNVSIGTMRLNRYILLKFFKKHNLNLYHPEVTTYSSKQYEMQIATTTGSAPQQPKRIEENRIFDSKMSQQEFNANYIKLLNNSYMNIVASQPTPSIWRNLICEKFLDTVLCKAVPLMLSGKDENRYLFPHYNFVPYVGFAIEDETIDNHVERWTRVLDSNLSILKNSDRLKNLYEMNQKSIEHNFKVLTTTDWLEKRKEQYNLLPDNIKALVFSEVWKIYK